MRTTTIVSIVYHIGCLGLDFPDPLQRPPTGRGGTRNNGSFAHANGEYFFSICFGDSSSIQVQVLQRGKIIANILLLNILPILDQSSFDKVRSEKSHIPIRNQSALKPIPSFGLVASVRDVDFHI